MRNLESKFAGFNIIGSVIDEKMRVAILMYSLSELESFTATLRLVNTSAINVRVYDHNTIISLQERKRQAHRERINELIADSSNNRLISMSSSRPQIVKV